MTWFWAACAAVFTFWAALWIHRRFIRNPGGHARPRGEEPDPYDYLPSPTIPVAEVSGTPPWPLHDWDRPVVAPPLEPLPWDGPEHERNVTDTDVRNVIGTALAPLLARPPRHARALEGVIVPRGHGQLPPAWPGEPDPMSAAEKALFELELHAALAGPDIAGRVFDLLGGES